MKAISVIETILIVGMCVIAALMFIQILNEINDLTKLLALSSANAIAKDIAGLLTTTAIAPHNITLNYALPEEASYNISLQDYTVYVNVSWDKPIVRVENSSARTTANISAQLGQVKILKIHKFIINNQNFWGVAKYE